MSQFSLKYSYFSMRDDLEKQGTVNYLVRKKTLFKLSLVLFVLIIFYYLITTWYHHNQPLTIYGNVDIRDVNLGFRVSGRLLTLNVDEGDTVHSGELIGHLDPGPYIREV